MTPAKGKSIFEIDAESLSHELSHTLLMVRKVAGVNQVELGKILDLHQSAVSRIEMGDQLLTPRQMILLATFFDISFDDFIRGTVDYWRLAEKFKRKAPFPARFIKLPYSKVRDVLPILKFTTQSKGDSKLKEVLNTFEVLPEYLKNPDMNLGTGFAADLYSTLLDRKLIQLTDVNEIAKISLTKEIQGFLSHVYDGCSDAISLLRARISNSKHYESNFDYQLNESQKNQAHLVISPAKHMSEVKYSNESVGDLICGLRKEQMKLLPTQIGLPRFELKELECSFHGGAHCIYQIAI